MYVHFHSLYAGVITLLLALVFRMPLVAGVTIVVVCLLMDLGQFLNRLQHQKAPWAYAAGSLIQSAILFVIFVLARYAMYAASL